MLDYTRRLLGYADRVSLRPGDTVDFKISAEDLESYDFDVVRLVNGVMAPGSTPFKEIPVETEANGTYPGRFQSVHAGSYAVVPKAPALDRLSSFTLQAYIMPTLPGDGRQTIMSRGSGPKRPGFALILDDDGALALMVGNGEELVTVTTGVPMLAWEWAFVAATYDAETGDIVLWQEPDARFSTIDPHAMTVGKAPAGIVFTADHDLHMAAWQVGWHDDGKPRMAGLFNGRIDSPRIASKALVCGDMSLLAQAEPPDRDWLVASWDFGRDIPTDRFPDLSANRLNGHLVNLPTRAVTGHHWDSSVQDWTQNPSHYSAIHFHDDDVLDAGWQTDVSLTLPDDMRSGVYCARCRSGEDEFYMPFFVRPAKDGPKHKIAFLASTATYLAYSNYHWQTDEEKAEVKRGRIIAYAPDELFLNERRDLGLSTYDTHRDGSGSMYSSRLRPIVLNYSPKGSIWSFNADTHVTDWMEAKGHAYDVVTDEAIHYEGLEALAPHNVIVTGTHPEYWSTVMWDAMIAYLGQGGRLMYLGGNGFYWRIAFHPERPGDVIEVRRPESGARFWASRPGESYLSFSGEYGGLWKRIGRPPQSLVGIGTFATGFDTCGWY
ncbi:MAG: N,N-dimethylformamidase beta subunit family domain-containing protein, partial [Pseudomonadota bacterium]